MMKLAKSVLVFWFDFPGGSSNGFKEKSLARNGKTNIVHAPPRLAEEGSAAGAAFLIPEPGTKADFVKCQRLTSS